MNIFLKNAVNKDEGLSICDFKKGLELFTSKKSIEQKAHAMMYA